MYGMIPLLNVNFLNIISYRYCELLRPEVDFDRVICFPPPPQDVAYH